MPRHPIRPLIPALALLAFTVLGPTHAAALPQGPAIPSAVVRPGVVSQIRTFLSLLWSGNGSILDPNGTPGASPGPGAAPGETTSGDNGSILDPNG